MPLAEYHLSQLIEMYGKLLKIVSDETTSLTDSYETDEDQAGDDYNASFLLELKQIDELLEGKKDAFVKVYNKLINEQRQERNVYYKAALISAGDPFSATLSLLSDVLESGMTFYNITKHVEMIKDAAIERGAELATRPECPNCKGEESLHSVEPEGKGWKCHECNTVF